MNFLYARNQKGQRNHYFRIRIVQLILQFAFGIERIILDGRGPDAKDRIVRNNDLGYIGQTQGNFISRFDAQFFKRAGEGVHKPVKLLEGYFFSHIV